MSPSEVLQKHTSAELTEWMSYFEYVQARNKGNG